MFPCYTGDNSLFCHPGIEGCKQCIFSGITAFVLVILVLQVFRITSLCGAWYDQQNRPGWRIGVHTGNTKACLLLDPLGRSRR